MDEETRQLLASRLGLPEDASEEQINEALDAGQAAIAASSAPAPEGDPAPGDPVPAPGDPAPGEPAPGDPAPEASAEDDGTVRLDKETYEQLKTGAALAVSHNEERKKDRITATVSAAVQDGKIPPARRKHWETALATDFEGNKALLDSLEDGLVPVTMRGNAGNADDGVNAGNGEGLPDAWFPEIAQARASAAPGGRVLQAREG